MVQAWNRSGRILWESESSGRMAVGVERPQSDLGASSSNARGIAAMLVAMGFFCTSDSAIKIAGEALPVGELMFLRGLFGTMFIFMIARYTGSIRNYPTMFNGKVLWRTICDAAATISFISGVVIMPFANASAIAQVTPLVVTALAAVLLAEPVGWRRWLATAVGLVGVIIIIKPGTDAFNWAALWVIASVIFVAVRDIHTRKMGAGFDPILLTGMSTIGVMQYIAPTMQFLIGVLVFREAFDLDRAIGFGFIWAALGIFAADGLRRARRKTI